MFGGFCCEISARKIPLNPAFLCHHAATLTRVFRSGMRHDGHNGFLTHISS
jgi:hypothetical protein